MVKRYNGVELDPDGVYVMFEDFERLTAESSKYRLALYQELMRNGKSASEASAWLDIVSGSPNTDEDIQK